MSIRLWLLFAWGSFKNKPAIAKCDECKKWRWMEDIVSGFGTCWRCWQHFERDCIVAYEMIDSNPFLNDDSV